MPILHKDIQRIFSQISHDFIHKIFFFVIDAICVEEEEVRQYNEKSLRAPYQVSRQESCGSLEIQHLPFVFKTFVENITACDSIKTIREFVSFNFRNNLGTRLHSFVFA